MLATVQDEIFNRFRCAAEDANRLAEPSRDSPLILF